MGGAFCQLENSYQQSIYFKDDCFESLQEEVQLRQFAEKSLKTISSRVLVKYTLWQNQILAKFIQNVQYWSPGYELSFKNNRKANIITVISEINFPNLKKINLAGNNIDCVENLSRIWLPFLQILQLGSNFSGNSITDIRSLRKMYCPYLFDVVLQDKNSFKDSKTILNFHSIKIRFLYLQEIGNEQVNDEDIRWLIKLVNNEPFTLDVSNNRRIVQKQFQQVLKKKMKKGNLYFKNH